MTPQDARLRAQSQLDALVAPERRRLGRAGAIGILAECLWIVQAGAIALGPAALLGSDGPALDPFPAAGLFALAGLLRHGLDAWAAREAFLSADAVLAGVRADIVAAESLRSPLDGTRPPSAAMAALVAEKVAALHPYLVRYRPAQLRVMVVPLVFLATALPLSWIYVAILLVAGPLIPVFMALIGHAARAASERQMVEIGALNTLLLDRLAAMLDIRLLDARGRAVAGFARSAEDLRLRTMGVLKVAFLSSTVLELFSALGVAMVAVYVGFALLGEITIGAWSGGLKPQEGIFLLMLAPAYFQPFRDLAAAWHDRAAAQAVLGELADLAANRERKILGRGAVCEPLTAPARIRLRGLQYVTPAGRRIAYPDLEVAPGEALAITGPSGSGKSALLALMAGLARPDAGTVEVAGRPLTDEIADAWRARVGWVGQAPHFLAASLRANLLLGPKGARDATALQDALGTARATGIVARLPAGLESRLGETGAGVSGGEARRLVLARAAASGADVILADEPTADLDAETAAQITRGLLDLKARGVTLIVATHDPALAARLDHQVALEAEA